MLRCRLLGHGFRFISEGATMRWRCARGCGAAGEETYATANDAVHYARASDHEDREELGHRARFFGLLPLRLARALRGRRAQT